MNQGSEEITVGYKLHELFMGFSPTRPLNKTTVLSRHHEAFCMQI